LPADFAPWNISFVPADQLIAERLRQLLPVLPATLDQLDRADFSRAAALLCDPRTRIVTTGGRYSSLLARSTRWCPRWPWSRR